MESSLQKIYNHLHAAVCFAIGVPDDENIAITGVLPGYDGYTGCSTGRRRFMYALSTGSFFPEGNFFPDFPLPFLIRRAYVKFLFGRDDAVTYFRSNLV